MDFSSIDATTWATIWATISLVIFIGVIIYFGVPKMITKMLDQRIAQIETDLAEAKRLREEAEALLVDYERKRVSAEGEAEGIVTAAKEEAKRLADDASTKLSELIADFMKNPVPAHIPAELRKLRQRVVEAAPTRDPKLLGALYNDLHETLLDAIANEALKQVSDRLYRQTARVWVQLLPEMDWDEEVRIFLDESLEALEGSAARHMAEIRSKHMIMLLNRFNDYLTRPLI